MIMGAPLKERPRKISCSESGREAKGGQAAIRVPAADTPEPKPTLTKISWLAGTWTSDAGGRQITEQWMSPAGGTMLGMSRTVNQGRTVEFEFLLLRVESNGDINYVAKSSGQAEARSDWFAPAPVKPSSRILSMIFHNASLTHYGWWQIDGGSRRNEKRQNPAN
jgi:hypothetical protein